MQALLALFLRSLREETRLASTYWMRTGLVLLVLFMLIAVQVAQAWTGAPGLKFFGIANWVNLVFISLAGLSYFSSAITEEKEENTLGLLRMADLSPLSIVLGKSTSRLCGALLLLLVQLPFATLAVSLGGVNIIQIFAGYLCLAGYTFFLANLSLLFSVICRRSATAAFLAGGTMFVFFHAPDWILFARGLMVARGWIPTAEMGPFFKAWQELSPGDRLIEITSTGFSGAPANWQFFGSVLLGLICFAVAWAVFGRFADRHLEAAPSLMRSFRSGGWRNLGRAGRAWKHALLWKEFYFMSGGWAGAALRIVICAIATVLCFAPWRKLMDWHTIGLSLTGCFAVLVGLDFAIAASRIFRLEHKWQTLSSLALLPISMRRLAWTKILAAAAAALPFLLMLLVGLVIQAPETWTAINKTFAGPSRSFAWFFVGYFGWLGVSVIFLLHLIAAISLRVKWGALPLSLALWMISFPVSLMIFGLLFQQAGQFLLIAIYIAATGALHVNTGQRLRQLAAED